MTAPDMSVSTDNGRFYRKPGDHSLVPSITNVINKLAKPGIAYWGYRQCATFVAENLDTVNALAGDPGAIIDLVRGAPSRATDRSSSRGDLVHGWIDERVRTQGAHPTTKEVLAANDSTAAAMWRHFLQLEEDYKVEWLFSETTVWSDTHGYAGTIDWMANVFGSLTLGDTKTGKNIYPSVGLQLAAAAHADYAFDDHGNEFQLPQAERFAALHLRPQGARLNPISKMDENWAAFLGLRAVFEWEIEHSNDVVQYSPKIQASE